MIDKLGSDSIDWELDCPQSQSHLSVSRAEEVAAALLSPEERCYPDCDGKCGLEHTDLRR
jgi:hypothetical protein